MVHWFRWSTQEWQVHTTAIVALERSLWLKSHADACFYASVPFVCVVVTHQGGCDEGIRLFLYRATVKPEVRLQMSCDLFHS